jgi:hypothetical protein
VGGRTRDAVWDGVLLRWDMGKAFFLNKSGPDFKKHFVFVKMFLILWHPLL